ncbi:TIGR04255 family protein [Pseudomonas guariconensis]|uniref:TIGR04255 family protein n=1 Tax=Pseudomonas guariconensis TaxID=1288410 RepID=UPI0039E8F96F
MTFDKAPLVELIVELKWGHAAFFQHAATGTFAPPGFFMGDPAQNEELYSRFGKACYANGLQRAERLIPQGFPHLPGQAVCRYQSGEDPVTKLLQIGQGVFTANALPPYKSWNEFLPFFKSGYEALLKSRSAEDNAQAFSQVSIRYINAFGADYLEKFAQTELLKNLGFNLTIPDLVSELSKDGPSTNIVINYGTSLKDGGKLAILVGSGQAGSEKAMLFDITISYDNVVCSLVEDHLHKAQEAIEQMFIEATKPLHHMMAAKEA